MCQFLGKGGETYEKSFIFAVSINYICVLL